MEDKLLVPRRGKVWLQSGSMREPCGDGKFCILIVVVIIRSYACDQTA